MLKNRVATKILIKNILNNQEMISGFFKDKKCYNCLLLKNVFT